MIGAATATAGMVAGDPDRKLTLNLPASVTRQLKARMATEDTTLRALVLEALAAAGYAVPARRPAGLSRLGTSFT